MRRPDGRWEARISFEGKRKSFYGKTRQEAARLLAKGLRDRDSGLPLVSERQTLEQYLATWLATIKPTVKPRTYQSYENLLRVHVFPRLGTVSLSKLSPQQLQVLYATDLETGSSTTTVHHIHMVLHRALHAAFRLGLVQRNVCDLVDPPRMVHHEIVVLSAEQVREFLEAVKGERLEALFVLAITTGMRQGELLALRWKDLDLDAASLTIRATLQRLRGQGFVFSSPKTRKSWRKITLSARAVEVLRRHRTQQATEGAALGSGWDEQDLVFPNGMGRPLEGGNVLQRELRPLLAKAGLPKIRFHDLRHTAATLLLLQGVHVKIVSGLLGHASVAITMDLYSHVLPNMQRQAASAMDTLLDSYDS